jgi:hypothetical protein
VLKILLVVLLVALLIYAVTRLLEKRGGATPRRRPGPRQAPPRVLGPDDDPDFLRDLERERRKRQEDEPDAG